MKRSFSLLEVLLSLALFAMLVTALFSWYNHLSQGRLRLKEERWPTLERRYCFQRLEKILPAAEPPFFTSEGLVFTFERSLADDPLFTGRVIGKLYHDAEHQKLCLGLWPYIDSEHNETYILLTDVSEMKLEFFSSAWQTSWRKEEMPALMKLHLTHKGTPVTFAFDLHAPIRYSGELL